METIQQQTNQTDSKANLRQARLRERLTAQGGKRVEVKLSANTLQRLDQAIDARSGPGGKYEVSEYLTLLIIEDARRVEAILSSISPCTKCKSTYPQSCQGLHLGDSQCFLTCQRRETFKLDV